MKNLYERFKCEEVEMPLIYKATTVTLLNT